MYELAYYLIFQFTRMRYNSVAQWDCRAIATSMFSVSSDSTSRRGVLRVDRADLTWMVGDSTINMQSLTTVTKRPAIWRA